LRIPDIIPFGFIFIWLEKELIEGMLKIMGRWGFIYIENFCWIKKKVCNEVVRQHYRYFNKSKLSLFIFRKVNHKR
jgi:N6-adenosine-specific RNA methylase IME4